MSEYNSNAGGKKGRGGRRRSGHNNNRNHSNSSRSGFRPSRKPPEPTGWQKFLSAISFGLYKPQSIPAVRNASKPAPTRDNTPGPIARADRQARETARKEKSAARSSAMSAEVSNERLYVGNLSYDATESDLFELFNGSGIVKNAEVVVNSRTQRSKGFAFVTMTSVDGAKKAVADLNGKDFMGRPLIVGGAKPMPQREEREDRRERDRDRENESEAESESESQPDSAPVSESTVAEENKSAEVPAQA